MIREQENTHPLQQREGAMIFFSAAAMLLVFFFCLFNQLQPDLQKAEQALGEHRATVLEPGMDKETLRHILTEGNYFTDEKDVNLLVDSLVQKIRVNGTPDNLGALNKNGFAITAPTAWRSGIGGSEFQQRLVASRERLGFDSALYAQELTASFKFPAPSVQARGLRLSGHVISGGFPLANVLVQLRLHTPSNEDSLSNDVAYTRTDASGGYSFAGLIKDSGYSVLPLKPGYEFGTRRGTMKLSGNLTLDFTGQPHKLRLLGSSIYAQLKEDAVLLVRTPAAFTHRYQLIAGGFILSFLLVYLLLASTNKRTDIFLLPILMLLSGISMLLLFSIQDPLRDTMFAWQSLQGVIAGLAGYTIFCYADVGRLYTRWWFDPLLNVKKRNVYKLKGWTWLALAIVLALTTAFFGSGPEGSGVKVNLQLGGLVFQPGEITKYLLLVFLAAFFAANAEQLRQLSDTRLRFYVSLGVFAGIGAILGLYLFMGDMGPAMVVCFTFLFFYSIARGNLLFTLAAGIGYCLLLLWLPGGIASAIAFGLVLSGLVAAGHLKSRSWWGSFAAVAEAPVIVLLIIAAFTFGDQLPGVGDRLGERKAMWLSQWNNNVYGGDHLAHSYWTLASGGWEGQGIGRGFSNTMPAAHTDMILPSIGEEMGWIGLVAIFMLFGLLIHRSFLHARRSGQPFTFYLCTGIAIANAVQLLLIAAGSTGLMPLTGVAVPFLSYGKISLIINIAAIGIVAGISSRAGKPIQQTYIRHNYDAVLQTGVAFFLSGLLLLSAKLFFVQVKDRDVFLVKQARVVMRNGLPVYSHNPRIDKLMHLLAAGNIYDRNGLLIATSNPAGIANDFDSLQQAGLDKRYLQQLMHKHLHRFYPFGERMFYWTGDYNTRLFWGQSNGYFAEARHLTSLRGFGISRQLEDSVLTQYQADRFTKPVWQTSSLSKYDYSDLTAGLKEGIDSNGTATRRITGSDRDVHLSVDAALQTELQDSLHMSLFQNKRISVVVLDAATGDVLASALNPLPDLRSPELLELSDHERNQLGIPVTERDLGMTYPTAPGSTIKILTAMAGLNKMGFAAAQVKYNDIYRNEIFRDNRNEQEPFVPKVPFVDMHEAIVNSSNIFFIRLANENNLEEQLADLYRQTGMRLNMRGGYDYSFDGRPGKQSADMAAWHKEVLDGDRKSFDNPAYEHTTKRYRSVFSGLAWGQSVLTATPVSIARMAGAIANKGQLQPSRYVLQEAGQRMMPADCLQLARDTSYAALLKQFMIEQSSRPGKEKIKKMIVAGKTGTPERIIKGIKQSDGWYVFFAPAPGKPSYTVTCIRIETGLSSANAVLLGNTVAKILQKRSYITSF